MCILILRWIIILFSLFTLHGCSKIYYQQQLALPKKSSSASEDDLTRKIAIFFDGTRNNVEANTNVKRLHSLVSLQSKPFITTLYIEGVGVGQDVLGAGAGVGFQSRVVLAYNFLRNNYHTGDKIYIFGFSRGAYQARALTSMLQYVGLPDRPPTPSNAALFEYQIAQANILFTDMKEGFYNRRYPCKIAEVRSSPETRLLLKKEPLFEKEPQFEKEEQFKSRRVHVLGLWDTVGALGGGVIGWPGRMLDKAKINAFRVDVDNPNVRYGDQLRNVDNVFQAVSLDDDREWIFTPLLVTRQHLLSNKRLPSFNEHMAKILYDCKRDNTPDVDFSDETIDALEELPAGTHPYIQEVWFSGAHSDVGGGYPDTDLPGVSLNWMIEMLAEVDDNDKFKLLAENSRVREDVYGSSHDPDTSFYHKRNRNLAAYTLGDSATCGLAGNTVDCGGAGIHEPMPEFAGKLYVHESVFKRRNAMAPRDHENQYLDLRRPGTICVKVSDQLANSPILVEDITKKLDDINKACPPTTRPIVIEKWKKRTRNSFVETGKTTP